MLYDRLVVVGAEHLHAHHGEDEDDDGQHEAQVTEGAHRPADDADEQVQRWPRLGQLEHPQLQHSNDQASQIMSDVQHLTSNREEQSVSGMWLAFTSVRI